MGVYDETATAIYLRGGSRKEVMNECGINTNQVSSMSSRLGLHWSWPLENRKSGTAPADARPAKHAPEKKRDIRPRKERGAPPALHDTNVSCEAPLPPSAPNVPEEVPAKTSTETIPPLRPRLPPMGFVSERKKGLRAEAQPTGLSDEEKFLNAAYAKQFG